MGESYSHIFSVTPLLTNDYFSPVNKNINLPFLFLTFQASLSARWSGDMSFRTGPNQRSVGIMLQSQRCNHGCLRRTRSGHQRMSNTGKCGLFTPSKRKCLRSNKDFRIWVWYYTHIVGGQPTSQSDSNCTSLFVYFHFSFNGIGGIVHHSTQKAAIPTHRISWRKVSTNHTSCSSNHPF